MNRRTYKLNAITLIFYIFIISMIYSIITSLSSFQITGIILIILATLVSYFMYKTHTKRRHRKAISSVEQVDSMNGHEFEFFVGELYRALGYKAMVTKGSGDDGGDVIITKNHISTCLQAKRYKGTVGKKAIQEVYAAKEIYHTTKAAVITNSYFTKPAAEFAKN